jgi:hypothetical protein
MHVEADRAGRVPDDEERLLAALGMDTQGAVRESEAIRVVHDGDDATGSVDETDR